MNKEQKRVYRAEYYVRHKDKEKASYMAWCVKHPEYASIWRNEHRDRVRAANARYRAGHKDKRNAYQVKWYAKNKDKDKEKKSAVKARWHNEHRDIVNATHAIWLIEHPGYQTAWYAKHKDQQKAYRAVYRAEHKEEMRAYDARYAIEHPEQAAAKVRRHRALKTNAPVNDLTVKQWQEIRLAHRDHCFYCQRICDDLTQEHIIPLSRGGMHTVGNIVPACRSCNSEKNTKTIQEYFSAVTGGW